MNISSMNISVTYIFFDSCQVKSCLLYKRRIIICTVNVMNDNIRKWMYDNDMKLQKHFINQQAIRAITFNLKTALRYSKIDTMILF